MHGIALHPASRSSIFRFSASTLFVVFALTGLPAFLMFETLFPRPSLNAGVVGRAILFAPVVSALLGLVLAAGYGLKLRRWQYGVEFLICAGVLVFYGFFNLFRLDL